MNTPNNAKSAASIAAVKGAFLELIGEKPYMQISVSELCRRAGINRTTFYSHFSGTHDVLVALDSDLSRKIKNEILPPDNDVERLTSMDTMLRILTSIQKYQKLYKIYLSELKNSEIVRELAEYTKRKFVLPNYTSRTGWTREVEYFFAFCMQGTIGILEKWIGEDCREDAENVAELMERMLSRCIRQEQ